VIICPKYRRRVFVPPIDERLKEMILEKNRVIMGIGCFRCRLCLTTCTFL